MNFFLIHKNIKKLKIKKMNENLFFFIILKFLKNSEKNQILNQ